MVIAEQVERAMNHEMGRMGFGGNTLLCRFRRADAMSKHDVAEQHIAAIGCGDGIEKLRLHHREGEDVGRLVLAPIGGIQRLHRSEERRVGRECVSPWRSRWSPYH